jgi:hypothetical protein
MKFLFLSRSHSRLECEFVCIERREKSGKFKHNKLSSRSRLEKKIQFLPIILIPSSLPARNSSDAQLSSNCSAHQPRHIAYFYIPLCNFCCFVSNKCLLNRINCNGYGKSHGAMEVVIINVISQRE